MIGLILSPGLQATLRHGSDADIFIQTYTPVDDVSAWASLLIDM